MTYIRGTLAERFWPKVEINSPDECWLWQAAKNNRGYGVIGRGPAADGIVLAHRASFAIASGRWPTGSLAHTCDNPPCVNPGHLVEGSHLDNMRDMIAKGRDYHHARPDRHARGERNNHAKLTDELVREIRASAEGSASIARRLGVDRHTIAHVRNGSTWRHVV
jgi:HNH endonuclease